MTSTPTRLGLTALAAFLLTAAPGAVVAGATLVDGAGPAEGSTSAGRTSAGAGSSAASGGSSDTWTRRDGGTRGPSSTSGTGGTEGTDDGAQLTLLPDGTVLSGTKVAAVPGVVMVDTQVQGGEGEGTGMVLTAGGQVLTNYHVVQGSSSVRVTDPGTGRSWTGTVVGHDADHDVAVVQLTGASGLRTVTLSDDPVAVGDAVTAVGQGGGQGALYRTSGTVSALDRTITAGDEGGGDAERLTGLIQTTADVVPGYSGGPLLDASGRVVGIDTAASSSGDIDGYAIPIAQATRIADQIVAGERSATVHIGARAALGVSVTDDAVTPGPAAWGGSGRRDGAGWDVSGATGSGAQVAEVLSGSAAERAGIDAGSTITAVDGEPVGGATDLTQDLSDDYPGNRVRVTWTDASGVEHTATVTLGTSTVN